ncbi:MAG TPA: DUF1425 domain-containing protein [Phycisphaerae bacterium]|nr:DUF1425 domain-containing protein [Phycisphaerae bacterium]
MLKNLVLVCALGTMGLAITGCTDPINAWQDPIVEYPQVHVDAYSMQQRIRVQKPIATRFGAGQLQVDVPIRNLTDDDLTIDYVYYFMDSKGIQIGEPETAFLRVQRKGIGQIEIKSLSAAAADFRVEIKDAK